MNILVVEDEAIVAMDLELKLEDMGYNVVNISDNYDDAILVPESSKVDLALLDVNIQGEKTGVDIARYFKKHYGIPCVFLTAFSNNAIINQAKEVGAYGYVLKPYSKKDLYTVVEIVQSKHQKDQVIHTKNEFLEGQIQERTKDLVRLNDKLSEEIEYRKQLEKDLKEVESRERKRIAKELHDGLSQRLTAVKFSLAAIRKKVDLPDELATVFKESCETIEESLREIRDLSHQLMPSEIKNNGLYQSMENTCSRLNELGLFEVTFDGDKQLTHLTSYQETVLYRIFQESINNAIKHADAKRVQVELSMDEGQLKMRVSDNGSGMSSEHIKGGIGLENLKERCENIGAKLEVFSEENKGTDIICILAHNE